MESLSFWIFCSKNGSYIQHLLLLSFIWTFPTETMQKSPFFLLNYSLLGSFAVKTFDKIHSLHDLPMFLIGYICQKARKR